MHKYCYFYCSLFYTSMLIVVMQWLWALHHYTAIMNGLFFGQIQKGASFSKVKSSKYFDLLSLKPKVYLGAETFTLWLATTHSWAVTVGLRQCVKTIVEKKNVQHFTGTIRNLHDSAAVTGIKFIETHSFCRTSGEKIRS